MTLIKCYLSQGRWTEALVLVEDLREYESSLELEVYYARALFGNGDKSEALQIYQQARLKGANICDELEKISKILQDVSKHLAPQTNIARASSLLFLNRVLHQITYQNLLT